MPRANKAVPAPSDLAAWYNTLHLEERGGPTYIFPSRGYTQFSDSLAAAQAATVVSSTGATFHIVPEPTLRPMAIHETGLVVIGAPAFTPFVGRLLKGTPFSVTFDPVQNDEVIVEGPSASPKTVFTAKRDKASNRFSSVYGLITVLPRQPGRDRPERTLIFTGITGSPGAEAAVQFFSSPAALRDLKERFRREGHQSFPPAYQVVVRCGVDFEAAINSVYETHRVIAVPPVIE